MADSCPPTLQESLQSWKYTKYVQFSLLQSSAAPDKVSATRAIEAIPLEVDIREPVFFLKQQSSRSIISLKSTPDSPQKNSNFRSPTHKWQDQITTFELWEGHINHASNDDNKSATHIYS